MAHAVFGNRGRKDSLLCSRCFAEINPIVINDDDDLISPLSHNSNTSDNPILIKSHDDAMPSLSRDSNTSDGLLLGCRKRKREFMSDGRNGHDDNVVEIIEKANDPQGMRWMSHSGVAEMLKELVRKSKLPKKEESAILDMIAVLEKKPNLKPLKGKVVKSDRPHPKPGREIEQLLRGEDKKRGRLEIEAGTEDVKGEDIEEREKYLLEEDRHPWVASKKNGPESSSVQGGPPATTAPKILMRVWDDRSQARIRDGTEGFLSGCNYMPLDTKEQRKIAIENHANWKNRRKTAFISASTDIEDIVNGLVPRLEARQERNGLPSITKITLINGNADGMPILSIRKELDFYECHVPYETSNSSLKEIARIERCKREGKKMPENTVLRSWYNTEYVFLFRIPAEQIVKTWLWKDVKQWMIENKTKNIQRWYQEVLVRAYNRHEQNRKSGSAESAHEPNCSCCGH
jgi:hypothetical protein